MNKTRTNRIIIGLFGPYIVGSIFMTGMLLLSLIEKKGFSAIATMQISKTFLFLLVFSVVFAGIQSIIYTVLMEFYVSKIKNIALFVTASTLLGLAAGLIANSIDNINDFNQLTIVGLLTGLTLGLILYFLHERDS